MPLRIGIVMDPIASITPYKDTTLALMLAAQARGHTLFYLTPAQLHVRDGIARGLLQTLTVHDDKQHWFQLGEPVDLPLGKLDVLLMRKDPPFDMDYIVATYVLELASSQGCCVCNQPRSLRDWNEKMAIARFPALCVPTLVSADPGLLRAFVDDQQQAVLKPLDGMGGAGVFTTRQGDPNLSVIIETLTRHGQHAIMAQRLIPEIREGDKRILIIDGEPLPWCLARIPAPGEARGNLAAGGHGEVRPLSERDRHIASTVGPVLKAHGLLFVGIDVIGDWLTEINVTSPTCLREIERHAGQDLASRLIVCLEQQCCGQKGVEQNACP